MKIFLFTKLLSIITIGRFIEKNRMIALKMEEIFIEVSKSKNWKLKNVIMNEFYKSKNEDYCTKQQNYT